MSKNDPPNNSVEMTPPGRNDFFEITVCDGLFERLLFIPNVQIHF